MPATTHRVVNPTEPQAGGRLSMPFFMHPHPDAKLSPSTVALNSDPVQNNAEDLGLTAHEFLHRRLFDNGLTEVSL